MIGRYRQTRRFLWSVLLSICAAGGSVTAWADIFVLQEGVGGLEDSG